MIRVRWGCGVCCEVAANAQETEIAELAVFHPLLHLDDSDLADLLFVAPGENQARVRHDFAVLAELNMLWV